jgi:hypothetical protein
MVAVSTLFCFYCFVFDIILAAKLLINAMKAKTFQKMIDCRRIYLPLWVSEL